MTVVIIIGSGILLISLFYYILFFTGNWPKKADFNIQFDVVRNLCKVSKSELPQSINILTIATGKLPSWAVSAGDFSGSGYNIEFPCFQIVYENKSVIVEVPFNKYLYNKFSFKQNYFQDSFDLMQKALLEADIIIPTHEHWDHLGGIAQSPNLNEIIHKVILTPEQIKGPTIVDAEFPNHFLSQISPFEYKDYSSIAPGIVLIKAPGHSVGHQFIYIQLQNGREFLFTGDVVWVNRNFETCKNCPWIASKKRLENRHQISHQMKYLYDNFVDNKNQKIVMVSTHDPKQHKEYIDKGYINEGLNLN
ncbi:MBL fold metallo-hydrolase [Marispirochaeta aestuarii]|uniref:MBL fold metallo-hydrolase n=1 Tax=Marispirochaeta aestuarii TaxID=1963862 RepID=UPI002ABDCD6F|nr:MBL fold metallo-hydrolase [Marispirochaeta aestuarii]